MWYNTATEVIGGELMMQHAQGIGGQQSQQYQRKVHGWLMGEGWQVGEGHDDKVFWLLTATDTRGKKIVVFQPRDKADVIIIQAGIKTDENFRRHLSEMSVHDRNAFYFDLQYALLQMGVEYANIGDPFELALATQRIYSESLIRDAFIQRVMLVRNAQVMMLLKTASIMNEPPPELPPIGFHSS